MPKNKKKSVSPVPAVLFLVLVGAAIMLSLLLNIFSMVEHSIFDPSSRFTFVVLAGDESQVISFSQLAQNRASLLYFNGGLEWEEAQSRFSIPIEAYIKGEDLDLDNNSFYKITLGDVILGNNIETNLTRYDLLRMFIFQRGVSEAQILKRETNLSADSKDLELLFADPKIKDEARTIEIVNASETPGLGQNLASIISNAGGNVILVSTSDAQQSYIAYSGEKSYTVEKLGHWLNMEPRKVESNGVSDIVIQIAQDKAKKFSL